MRHHDDWLNAYMEATKDSEAPSRFRLWSGISLIASVLGRKVWIEWEGNLYPNMYIILVGPAGSMKGTAMRIPKKLLVDLELPVASDATTREQFIEELSNARRFFNYNGEQIWHSSLTVFSKEINVLVNERNRDLVINLIDWFDCDDDFAYRTKTSGKSEASGVYLNLQGAVTPDLLAQSMPPESRGSGFISRTHFIYADEKEQIIYFPTDVDPKIYKTLIEDLDDMGSIVGIYRFDKSFIKPWKIFVDEIIHNPPFAGTVLESYDNRLRIHILKLTMILNASRDGKQIITSEDLSTAIALNEEARNHMQKSFIGMGTAKNAHLIPVILREVMRVKSLTFSQLLSKLMNDISKNDLIEIISSLKSSKQIEIIPIPGEQDFTIVPFGTKNILMSVKT